MFATLKMLFVYTVLGVPLGIVGIPWTLMTGDVTWMYWRAMAVVRMGVRAAGIRVRVTGLENVPGGRSCIFMANHVSNLDPPVLIPMIPARCSVMLKKGLMSIPILGTAMRQGGFIPVERGAGTASGRESAKAAAKALADGLQIVVFPEGTRSVDARLSRFKKGPFFLAQQTNAPIVPVAVWGTEKMMGKGTARITPGEAHVALLPVVEPGAFATRDELMEAVRMAIAGALPEEMRPAAGEEQGRARATA